MSEQRPYVVFGYGSLIWKVCTFSDGCSWSGGRAGSKLILIFASDLGPRTRYPGSHRRMSSRRVSSFNHSHKRWLWLFLAVCAYTGTSDVFDVT